MGREMLNILKMNDLRERVIFVVRYYGFIKLGSQRFDCFSDAALDALTSANLKVMSREQMGERKLEIQRKKKEKFEQQKAQRNKQQEKANSIGELQPWKSPLVLSEVEAEHMAECGVI